MLRLIHIFLYYGKTVSLTIIICFLFITSIKAQNQKKPLIIESDINFIEEVPSFSNLLEQHLGMYIPAYVYNSINTKSIVALSFLIDSTYNIASTYSENMPPLLKNQIVAIFKKWSEMKGMKLRVDESQIILNKKYIIPIIFHFRYTSYDESVPTFKKDYESLEKFIKNMDWSNTEMMDFIMIDKRKKG